MQKIIRLAALAAALPLLLSACATTRDAPLADGGDVALGQKAFVAGPIVEPVAVVEDSRCPMNARCIWAGRVRVKMLWHRSNGKKQPFEVELGKPVHLADGAFTLTSARPEKQGTAAIEPGEYRFSFTFAGGL